LAREAREIGDRTDCWAVVAREEQRELWMELDAVMKDPRRKNGA
jgi:hypothetical protein